MPAKVILVLCAQALFIQATFGSCLGRGAVAAPVLIALGCAGNGLIGNGLIGNWASNGIIGDGIIGNGLIGNGLAGIGVIPTSGGGLPVSSVSTLAPSGLSIDSENVFEGALSVTGELPFVSAVALDAVLPSAGAGAVNHSWGNGVTAIESIAPSAAVSYGAGYGLGTGYGAGVAGITPAALGLELGGCGCGCGVY